MAVRGAIVPAHEVLELALDIGKQGAGTQAEAIGVQPRIAQLLLHDKEGGRGEHDVNAAALLHHGKKVESYCKSYLPNYGVFDEDRYFMRGSSPLVFRVKDLTFGVTVCEDIWYTVTVKFALN